MMSRGRSPPRSPRQASRSSTCAAAAQTCRSCTDASSRRAPMAAPADTSRTADARRAARRAEKAPSGGWRTIAAKELADHLGSVRFLVLLVVIGVAAVIPLYFISTDITAAAPQVAGQPALFLVLFLGGSNPGRGVPMIARAGPLRPPG